MALRALARVNLAAIQRNAARLRARLTDGTELCAVVKAQASGHGAVATARAALAGGATRLAVATVGEAAELREAGLATPILIMGAISAEELPVALTAGAELVGWSERFVDDLVRAAAPGQPIRVHVKLDTGMGRLGTRELNNAVALAERLAGNAAPGLTLAGAMTHFATADCDPEFLAGFRRLRPSSSACATVIAATECSSMPPTARPRSAGRQAISTWCAVESPSTVVIR